MLNSIHDAEIQPKWFQVERIHTKVVKNAFSWGFHFLYTTFAQIKVFGAVKNRLSWG